MDVTITLLGSFSVALGPTPVAPEAWSRRGAASLVKLLSVAEGRRMHREQVMDALWPDLPVEAATPRLHKAAHYARRALGGGTGLTLRNDLVMLYPDADVRVDAVELRRAAEAAVASGAEAEAERVLADYPGPFLPGDLYEPWTSPWREALDVLHEDLLRLAGRWEELVRVSPADEEAHLALAREHAERGDVRAALRQLERMEQALRRELGTAPSAAAQQLRSRLSGAIEQPVAGRAGPSWRGGRDQGPDGPGR